jgi:hypothetical protein
VKNISFASFAPLASLALIIFPSCPSCRGVIFRFWAAFELQKNLLGASQKRVLRMNTKEFFSSLPAADGQPVPKGNLLCELRDDIFF